MSLSDSIKDKLKTANMDKSALLAKQFNQATGSLMEKFLSDVQLGHITLSSVNDYQQLFKIFQEVNHLSSDDADATTGAPPELSLKEAQSFENFLKVHNQRIIQQDGNITEKAVIDKDAIEKMSAQDVDKMAADRTTALNNRNGNFDVD